MSLWTDIHIQVQIIYSACRYSNDNKNTQSMDSHRYHIKAAKCKKHKHTRKMSSKHRK